MLLGVALVSVAPIGLLFALVKPSGLLVVQRYVSWSLSRQKIGLMIGLPLQTLVSGSSAELASSMICPVTPCVGNGAKGDAFEELSTGALFASSNMANVRLPLLKLVLPQAIVTPVTGVGFPGVIELVISIGAPAETRNTRTRSGFANVWAVLLMQNVVGLVIVAVVLKLYSSAPAG